MKNVNVFFWALISTLTIVSCAKEWEQSSLSNLALSYSPSTSSIQLEDPSEGMAACFDYVFPIQVRVGNETYTANNIDELNRLLASKSTSNVRSAIVFPITVIMNATKEKRIIKSQEELSNLQRECAKNDRKPNGGPVINRLKCYKYVFPLTVVLKDGSTRVVANQDELNALIRSTDSRGGVKLTFPFKVTLSNGTEITINNQEELARLETSCRRSLGGR